MSESFLAQLRAVHELGVIEGVADGDLAQLPGLGRALDDRIVEMLKGAALPVIRRALRSEISLTEREVEARYLAGILAIPDISEFIASKTGKDRRNIAIAALTAGDYLTEEEYREKAPMPQRIVGLARILKTERGLVPVLTSEEVLAPFRTHFRRVYHREGKEIRRNLRGEIEKQAVERYRKERGETDRLRNEKGMIEEEIRGPEICTLIRENPKKDRLKKLTIGVGLCLAALIGYYAHRTNDAHELQVAIPARYEAIKQEEVIPPIKSEGEGSYKTANEGKTEAKEKPDEPDSIVVKELDKKDGKQKEKDETIPAKSDQKIKPSETEKYELVKLTAEEIQVAPYVTQSQITFGYAKGNITEDEYSRFEKVLNNIIGEAYKNFYEKQGNKLSAEEFKKGIKFEIHYTAKTSIDGKFTGYDNGGLAQERKATTERTIRSVLQKSGFDSERQCSITSDCAPESIEPADQAALEQAAQERALNWGDFVQTYNQGGYERVPNDRKTTAWVEGILSKYRKSEIDRIVIYQNRKRER